MDNLPGQDKYATPGGLRGAAAALVVMVHFPLLLGLTSIGNDQLAVDLLFAMSSFVIVSAYGKKLSFENTGRASGDRLRRW